MTPNGLAPLLLAAGQERPTFLPSRTYSACGTPTLFHRERWKPSVETFHLRRREMLAKKTKLRRGESQVTCAQTDCARVLESQNMVQTSQVLPRLQKKE